MTEVEIKEVKPQFANSGMRGFKVLQYLKVKDGERSLVGSRFFEDEKEAEQYKKQLEIKNS